MSFPQLVELELSRALEPTRRFEDLAEYHVAFDELNGDKRTEAAFSRLVSNRGKLAIIGRAGSGKSSVIASILGPFSDAIPDNVVPLRIPVAAELEDTVTEPG